VVIGLGLDVTVDLVKNPEPISDDIMERVAVPPLILDYNHYVVSPDLVSEEDRLAHEDEDLAGGWNFCTRSPLLGLRTALRTSGVGLFIVVRRVALRDLIV
jgi:hypothetical protein